MRFLLFVFLVIVGLMLLSKILGLFWFIFKWSFIILLIVVIWRVVNGQDPISGEKKSK